MEKLIKLYQDLHSQGVICFSNNLPFSDNNNKSAVLQVGKQFGLFLDVSKINTIAEETAIVAHEAGHIATGSIHKVSSSLDLIAKHEYKANKWALKRLLPQDELECLFRAGYNEPWELAEQTNLPEEFICWALKYYQEQALVG